LDAAFAVTPEWSQVRMTDANAGPPPAGPRSNRLLAALPAADYERLVPHLELVPLELGRVLHESGATMRHVHFPATAIVSLLCVMEDVASAEIAMTQELIANMLGVRREGVTEAAGRNGRPASIGTPAGFAQGFGTRG
jgi:hypothetical protein